MVANTYVFNPAALAECIRGKGVDEVWIGLTRKPIRASDTVSTDPAAWYWASDGTTPDYDAWLKGKDGDRLFPSARYQRCASLVAVPNMILYRGTSMTERQGAWKNDMCGPGGTAVPKAFVCDIPY